MIDPHKYSEQVLNKGGKAIHKESFQQIVLEQLDIQIKKKKKENPTHRP